MQEIVRRDLRKVEKVNWRMVGWKERMRGRMENKWRGRTYMIDNL